MPTDGVVLDKYDIGGLINKSKLYCSVLGTATYSAVTYHSKLNRL